MPNDDLLTQIHRSIGFYSIPEAPYRIKFNKVKVKSKLIENKGNYELLVDYTTPIGSLNSTILYTNKMKMDGISLTYIKERIINGEQLYNLENDPLEQHNLIDQEIEIAYELRGRLKKWIVMNIELDTWLKLESR